MRGGKNVGLRPLTHYVCLMLSARRAHRENDDCIESMVDTNMHLCMNHDGAE